MSLFLEIHTNACKGEMTWCLGFFLKYFIEKRENVNCHWKIKRERNLGKCVKYAIVYLKKLEILKISIQLYGYIHLLALKNSKWKEEEEK